MRPARASATAQPSAAPATATQPAAAVRAASAIATAAAVLTATACDAGSTSHFHVVYAEIVAEEDARGEIGLDRVRTHLDSGDPRVRAAAVRALGRMEDPPLHGEIAPLLGDPDPAVSSAAATALAQSVFGQDPGEVARLLAEHIPHVTDAATLGAIAANLGRLTLPTPEHRAEGAVALTATVARALALEHDRDFAARLGIARGIEAFARGAPPGDTLTATLADAASALTALTVPHADPTAPTTARIRRTAAAALVHTDQLGEEATLRLLQDPDWGVRRQVVLGANRHGTAAEAVVAAALDDPDPRVRVEAVRAHHARRRAIDGCAAIIQGAADPDPRVAGTAIGLLARPCADVEAQTAALRAIVAGGSAEAEADSAMEADSVAEADSAMEADSAAEAESTPHTESAPHADWRAPARALHALAGIAPGEVAGDVGRLARHANPFARAWAARAAGQAGLPDVLTRLADDPHPNVREAALQGLGAVGGEGVAEASLAQLDQDDPQLVMTAARLLARLPHQESPAPALLAALARFTDRRRETERDVRVALLEAIAAVGGHSSEDLEPYLVDYDPVVADLAAALLNADGRAEREAAPRALPRTPPPDAERLAEMEGALVVLTMAGLGDIVIALRPDLAATNADRFARLAAEGRLDGLTFHRVEPNFVIQGGSPNANEYSGDGPYSRDEIGEHPHWRGTVGLSTRGRDTGDGQIFVNLSDNLRLDHNYTIFGVVVAGMEVVDAVQEGAVIERATVVRR